MKHHLIVLKTLAALVLIFLGEALPQRGINYFAQIEPDSTARLFAPGIISTDLNEFNASFSPDGREFYYSIREGWNLMTILCLHLSDGKWSEPQVASFSGKYLDADPFFSSDGRKLYFCSNRPVDENDKTRDWNIWVVEKKESSWGSPVCMEFNTERNEMYVSVAKSGNIYYHADYGSELQTSDINRTDLYYVELVNGKYSLPVKMSETVNSNYPEWDPYIAPDESFIIYTSIRPGGFGSGDFYISFKNEDGSWSQSKNMGGNINSTAQDYCPNFSPDGKYFFFSSYRINPERSNERQYNFKELKEMLNGPGNGSGDLYWIKSEVIEKLKETIWRPQKE